MAILTTSRAMVNVCGVSEKVSVPDYSDPQFAVSVGQSGGTGAVDYGMTEAHNLGVSIGLTHRSKEGISGPYDPNFNNAY